MRPQLLEMTIENGQLNAALIASLKPNDNLIRHAKTHKHEINTDYQTSTLRRDMMMQNVPTIKTI